jgi:transcriptional regulator with XRE-family HTH domain
VRPGAVKSAALLREARLRAGLSQHELAARSGKERTVIARWEHGAVSPSFDTVIELVRACGFDLPLELAPYDPTGDERIAELQMLSPERRLERLLDRGR